MSRAARLVTTRTGIVIGGAWTPPPPRDPGVHAERIQAALLMTPARAPLHRQLLAAAAALFATAVDAWHDAALLVLYRRHRRLGFGRWRSICRAVWCVLPF